MKVIRSDYKQPWQNPPVASRTMCSLLLPSSTLKNLVNPWPISFSFSSSAGDSFLQFSSQQDAPNIALEFSLFISKTAFHAKSQNIVWAFSLWVSAIGQGMNWHEILSVCCMNGLPTITCCCCLQRGGNAVDTSGTCLPIALFLFDSLKLQTKLRVSFYEHTSWGFHSYLLN